jgi:hypothetical protein
MNRGTHRGNNQCFRPLRSELHGWTILLPSLVLGHSLSFLRHLTFDLRHQQLGSAQNPKNTKEMLTRAQRVGYNGRLNISAKPNEKTVSLSFRLLQFADLNSSASLRSRMFDRDRNPDNVGTGFFPCRSAGEGFPSRVRGTDIC